MANGRPKPPWDIVPEDEQIVADRRMFRILCIVIGAVIIAGVLFGIALALNVPGPWTPPQRARLIKMAAWSAFGLLVVLGVCWLFQFFKTDVAEPIDVKCRGASVYFLQRKGKRHMRGRGAVLVTGEGLEMRGRMDPPAGLQLLAGLIAALILSTAVSSMAGVWLFRAATALAGFIALAVWLRPASVSVPADEVECIDCNGPYVTVRFSRPPVKDLESVRFYVNRALRREFFGAWDAAFPGMLPEDYRRALREFAPPESTVSAEDGCAET